MAANESRIFKNRRIILSGKDIDESSPNRQGDSLINLGDTVGNLGSAIGGDIGGALSSGADALSRRGAEINEPAGTGSVIFDVQPTVSESGSVSYFEIGDIRQAANMLIYMGTPSREFSINGRFVSRSKSEASRNWRYVQTLRRWRMPEQSGGELNATKTPSRLTMTGLGNWFNKITVRITSLNIEEPEDVDYIRTEDGRYDVPIVWPVTVSLKEAKSVEEMREFDINSFRQGTLSGW